MNNITLDWKLMKELSPSLHLGDTSYDFCLNGIDINGKFIKWRLYDYLSKGKWVVLFFYPADFTFVCPTEIKGFSNLVDDFLKEDAEIASVSVDSPFVHLNWQNSSLGKVNLSMLSDAGGILSKYLGIYNEEKGISYRGTFIFSPEGKLYVQYSTADEVGREPKEVLRLLQAAKKSHAGELPQCGWTPGQETLKRK